MFSNKSAVKKTVWWSLSLSIWALCIMLLTGCCCAAELIYSFPNIKQETQFAHLLKEFRCVVCQNQSLADSNAELAKDLRRQVYKLVRANNSDQEIINYLTSRYGDYILLKPPVKGATMLLWYGPLLFLLISFGIFITIIRRR